MSKNRTEIRHRHEIELQLRDGVPTAIISSETVAEEYNGRGYAGQSTTNRQVLVLPLATLGSLLSAITDGLTYDIMSADEKYDLVNEAKPRFGLYELHPTHDGRAWSCLAEFYTLAEARLYSQAFKGKGYTLRHITDTDDPMDFATSVIETI
jgi:hypothetical protein